MFALIGPIKAFAHYTTQLSATMVKLACKRKQGVTLGI
jgi:hypothetical protein